METTTTNKKILVIITIVGIVLLVVLVTGFFFLASPRLKPAGLPASPTVTPPSDPSTQFGTTRVETLSPLPTQQTYPMGTQSFTIYLSKEWTAQQDVSGQVESVVIKPVSTGESRPSKSMRISVEKYPGESRLDAIQRNYATLGYEMREVRIFGEQAIVMHGSIPAPVDEKTVKMLQDTIYVFVRNNTLYEIKYHYIGDSRDEATDYEFESMIASLELR